MHYRIPHHVTAMALGLDAILVAVVIGSLPWLGLGCFAIACGLVDGLRNPAPSRPDASHELD
jgi:hypothetical protein